MTSAETARFAYDEVPYDTETNPDAHPRTMHTLARLFGLSPRPPSTCRVLEIGCGNGEQLLWAAAYLPGARFVGLDLSGEAIAMGERAVKAAGLTNVQLLHRDVCAVDAAELGAFDYVMAHGVYSWVPSEVRPRVLSLMSKVIGEEGVAFVSCNALPGWELQRALRQLARHATRGAPAEEAVSRTLAMMDKLAALPDQGFMGVLAAQAQQYRAHVKAAMPVGARYSGYVFHDLLAEHNTPFSAVDVARDAVEAGLRVLCETPLRRVRRAEEEAGVSELAADMATSGVPFLQVLLCRAGAKAPTFRGTEAVRETYLHADLRPTGLNRWETSAGMSFEVPGPDAALGRAGGRAPAFVHVEELIQGHDGANAEANDVFAAYCMGALTLVAEPPTAIADVTKTPGVSDEVRRRARLASEAGAELCVLTSALHRSFRVPWAELVLVRELDGQASREQIETRVARAFAEAPPARIPEDLGTLARWIDAVLERLVRHVFLVK